MEGILLHRIVDTATACRILGGISRETLRKLKKAGKVSPVPYHRGRWDVLLLNSYLDQNFKSLPSADSIDDIVAKRLAKYGEIQG